MTIRTSIPDYIAGLDISQCQTAIDYATARMQTLKEGGKVDVWTVSASVVEYASLDQRDAIAWMAEALRLMVLHNKGVHELKIESSFEWKSEAQEWVARHAKSTPERFVRELTELPGETAGDN